MLKPRLPSNISKKYTIPEAIRHELEFEPYILTGPIGNFCDPSEHVDSIPVRILAELDLKHLYNDLIQGLYSLTTRNGNDADLNQVTKEYIKKVYTYCSKQAFQKKLFLRANAVLKKNEVYLNNIKIKEAKKRTAQEAELLGVDMTHSSIKQYRSEVLTNISNTRQSEQDTSYSPHEPNESSAKSITVEKNQKRFTLNSALSCLSTPHKPKVQKVDRKAIADLCSLGIESLENDDNYKNTDTMKEFKENRKMQEKNKSLSEVDGILDFLDDALNYDFAEFPCSIWSHSIHKSTDTSTKHLANIIAYTLTDFHCNCKQPMIPNSNHERTPYVEYVIPMFKYLSKQTGALDFSWCEKLVETQKYAQIVEVDYESASVDKKYADGLGKANNFESLFIESSSGLLQENISHTLEDTLKLLVECNGALCYILSHFKNSRFKTALKKPTFGVQVIKDTITLSKMNLKEEECVDMKLKKESSGLTIVPKEETLAALLGFPEF